MTWQTIRSRVPSWNILDKANIKMERGLDGIIIMLATGPVQSPEALLIPRHPASNLSCTFFRT